MSGASSSLGAAVEGFRPPFTAAQWRELEHQALVYKYLVEGVPVPAELLVPIRQSFESMSARFFPHSSLGYFSYYGKKMDPEPGRCRRTDGKKWRCSKDAYPGSKYCERHMHRGRNRSRKPVESQSTSQSLLTVMSQSGTGSSSGSSSFKNLPLQSMVNQDSLLGNSASKLQTEPVSNAMDNKEYRYHDGLKPEADEHGFHPEGPGSFQVLGMDQNVDNNTWHLMPSSVQVNRFPNPSYGAYLKSGFCQPNIGRDFESMSTPATSKQRQPHYFFGREVGSSGPVKQESHAARPFLDDWPRARESWPELDDQGYDKKSSSTQLSISVPTPLSEISTASACSPNELGAED